MVRATNRKDTVMIGYAMRGTNPADLPDGR